MGTFDTDVRTAALVLEVERRKKLPGLADYSYGRLIADTTYEERQKIVERYRCSQERRSRTGIYRGMNDQEILEKEMERIQQAGR